MNYIVIKNTLDTNSYTNHNNSFVNIYYDDDIIFGDYCYNIYEDMVIDEILDKLVNNLENLEICFY